MNLTKELGFIVGMVIVAVASAFTVKIINQYREKTRKDATKRTKEE